MGNAVWPVRQSPDYYAAISSPAQTLDATGLRGDADGDYLIDAVVVGAGAGQAIQFTVNAAVANLRARCGDFATGSNVRTDWTISSNVPYSVANGVGIRWMGRMGAKTGRSRKLQLWGFTDDAANDVMYIFGEWTDTTTAMTAFGIRATNASGLAVGTYVRLTPLMTDK